MLGCWDSLLATDARPGSFVVSPKDSWKEVTKSANFIVKENSVAIHGAIEQHRFATGCLDLVFHDLQSAQVIVGLGQQADTV